MIDASQHRFNSRGASEQVSNHTFECWGLHRIKSDRADSRYTLRPLSRRKYSRRKSLLYRLTKHIDPFPIREMRPHGEAQNLVGQLIRDGKGAFLQIQPGISLLAIRRQRVMNHSSDPTSFKCLLHAVALGCSNDVQVPAGLDPGQL